MEAGHEERGVMHMKTKNLMVGCAMGALMLSTAAWAGYKGTYFVNVDTTNRAAYGSYGDARSSADSVAASGTGIR